MHSAKSRGNTLPKSVTFHIAVIKYLTETTLGRGRSHLVHGFLDVSPSWWEGMEGQWRAYIRAGQETGLSGLSFSPAHEMMAPRLKADFSLQLILSRNILKDVPRCVPVSLMSL